MALLKPQVVPALAYVFPALQGPKALQEETRLFHTTALRDLKGSGAFHLLESGVADPSPSNDAWRMAGAHFLLRTASRSVGRGRLFVESECINLETNAVLLKKSLVGEARTARRMAHRLVDLLVGKVTGTAGIADSTIVFSRPMAPGIKEIFSVDRDGENLKQLTRFGSLTTHPALSSDGKLAAVTYKGGPPQIWGQTQPNGPFLRMYPRDGSSGLGLSDLAWSPGGKRLAFTQGAPKGGADIYVLDLRSNRASRLTTGGGTNWGPSWNPAGTELAYLSDRGGTGQIFIMDNAGTHDRRVTNDAAPKTCLAWNPLGDRLAYVSNQKGGTTLFTVDLDGSKPRELASSPIEIESIAWAPDGRWLVLGRKGAKEARLLIARLDGTTQEFAGAPGGSQFPQWIRNHLPLAALIAAAPSALHPGSAPAGAMPPL
jgi:TolB protein